MAIVRNNPNIARDIALEYADGLSVSGHISEKWVLPFFKVAMTLVEKNINTSDTKAMKKAFDLHGVPMNAKSESLINAIARKYINAQSTY